MTKLRGEVNQLKGKPAGATDEAAEQAETSAEKIDRLEEELERERGLRMEQLKALEMLHVS